MKFLNTIKTVLKIYQKYVKIVFGLVGAVIFTNIRTSKSTFYVFMISFTQKHNNITTIIPFSILLQILASPAKNPHSVFANAPFASIGICRVVNWLNQDPTVSGLIFCTFS